MSEQFVATFRQRGYPEYKGSKLMPEENIHPSKDNESHKRISRDSVDNQRREKASIKGKDEVERKRREEKFNEERKEAKAKRAQEKEEAEAKGKTPEKISFKEAQIAIESIRAVQDEIGIRLSEKDFKAILQVVKQHGHLDPKFLAGLTPKDVDILLVAAQDVLKDVEVEPPESGEFGYEEGSSEFERLKAELFGRQLKEVVKGERLELAKVREYASFENEDYGQEATSGSLGAERREPELPDLSFKELLLEKWAIVDGKDSQFSLADLNQEIQVRVSSDNPWIIGTAARELSEIREKSLRHDPARQAEFDTQVLTLADQTTIKNQRIAYDNHFRGLMAGLGEDPRFDDIKIIGERVLSGMISGWISRDEGEAQLYGKALQIRDIPGSEGLRLWFANQELDRVLNAFEIIQRTKVRPDPHDNIRAAEEAMFFFEQSQTVESFGLARQRLTDLVEAVNKSTDEFLAQEDRDSLKRRVDSFLAITPIFITMYQSEGDAEDMQKALAGLSNESWFNFLDRFSNLIDEDGNPYLEYRDAQGNKKVANFANEAIKAFEFQYQVDNYRKRQLSEMTKEDLDLASTDRDVQWIIARLKILYPGEDVQKLWNDDERDVKRTVLQKWYAEMTLEGVDDFATGTGQQRKDMREDELMGFFDKDKEHPRPDWMVSLRDRLIALGVPEARVDALLANSVLPRAVKSVAANYVRFSLSSALDKFRIYSKVDDPEEAGGKKLVASIFGEETPFFAREADHITDYFFSEGHGDQNVNKVIRRYVDERWRGYFLASNQVIYRIVNQLKLKNLLPVDMSRRIQREVDEELKNVRKKYKNPNLTHFEVEGYVIADMISKFNPNEPDDPKTINLSEINLAEASKELDSYSFKDNANDRAGTIRFYREQFKAFTFQPFDKELFEMLDKYYSTRHIRKRQTMDFFMDVYWEVGHQWKEWLDYKDNITSVSMEATIQTAIEHNVLDKKRAEMTKSRLLGRPFLRETKQFGILIFEVAKDILIRPGSLFGGFLDFWKTLFAYLTQQK